MKVYIRFFNLIAFNPKLNHLEAHVINSIKTEINLNPTHLKDVITHILQAHPQLFFFPRFQESVHTILLDPKVDHVVA